MEIARRTMVLLSLVFIYYVAKIPSALARALTLSNPLTDYTNAECVEIFDQANATGDFSVEQYPLSDPTNRAVRQEGFRSQNVSFRMTVNSPVVLDVDSSNETTAALTNIFFGIPSFANLTSDTLDFGGCAILVPPPVEVGRRAKGLQGDGTCGGVYSRGCIKALTKKAADVGWGLTATYRRSRGDRKGNLTEDAYPGVCERVAEEVFGGEELEECEGQELVGQTMSVPLTGPTYPPWTNSCSIGSPPSATDPSSHLRPLFNVTQDNYFNATQAVRPVLTVFFPPVDENRTGFIGNQEAYITCLSAANISAGSEMPPALPSGAVGLVRIGLIAVLASLASSFFVLASVV